MSLTSAVAATSFEGDAVGRAVKHNSGSAQEELARLQILQLKIQAGEKGVDSKERQVLGQLSEKEKVAVQILQHLNTFSESSPEAAQIAMMTGHNDKFLQAEWIAEKVVDQNRAQMFMSMYGPDKELVRGEFYNAQVKGLEQRRERLAADKKGLAAGEKVRSAAAEIAAAAAEAVARLRASAGGPTPS